MGKRSRGRGALQTTSSPYAANARSFELKLARSDQHLQHVEQQVSEWLQACFDSLREEADPEQAGYYCAWIDAPELDVQRLSLRVGDCLQCLRSALDHLAFELATTFTTPLPDNIAKQSEFPIFDDKGGDGSARFHRRHVRGAKAGTPATNSGLAKIQGMDPKAQTVIERLQPYHSGQAFEVDPLWLLHELNRIDKHRLLHVVSRIMTGATLPVPGPNLPKSEWPRNVAGIGLPTGEAFPLEIAGDIAAEGRTRVARWPMWPLDPNKKMHMGFRPVLGVIFDLATPLIGGESVTSIRAVHDYVVGDVIPPLRPFLK